MLHFVDALELCEFLPQCPREDKLVALYPCSKNASVWWGTVGIQHTAHASLSFWSWHTLDTFVTDLCIYL